MLGAAFGAGFIVGPTVGGLLGEFVPANALANMGDQVIWIWDSASHTVSSGVYPVSDGRFDSGAPLGNSGWQFAWRPTSTGTVPFFCDVHQVNTTMFITPSGTPVADMRITEVEFAGAGDQDRVQVSNLGDAIGSLGFYRLSSQAGVTTFLDVNPITLGPNERVTLHLGIDGTNTATDVFVPGAASLGSAGSLALYVPNNTTAAQGSSIPGTLVQRHPVLRDKATPSLAHPPSSEQRFGLELTRFGGRVRTAVDRRPCGARFRLASPRREIHAGA